MVPHWSLQAIVLAFPLFVHRLFVGTLLSLSVFLFAAFWAVRLVALWHIPGHVLQPESESVMRELKCQFSVKRKGLSRYIQNAQEERLERVPNNGEVTLLHIVTKAVAQALKSEPHIAKQRFCIPWLGIDHSFVPQQANLSLISNGGQARTIEGVQHMTIQDIANVMKKRSTTGAQSVRVPGHCRIVVVSPTRDPNNPHAPVIAMEGVASDDKPLVMVTQHEMSVTVAITIPSPIQTEACHRFASELHKLLQFPEMCDE